MRKGLLLFACVFIIAILSGCGEKENSVGNKNVQGEVQSSVNNEPNESAVVQQSETDSVVSSKTPPVIDHLDTYPLPVLSGWTEEMFVVREYDEGKEWEAVFTFDGDVKEEALAYKQAIEELGYETQTLLSEVFKIRTAEFAGSSYHGTFTFGLGDESSEWGEGISYVEILFSEKQ